MSLLFSDLEPADAEHSAAAAPPAPAPAAASTGPAEGTVTFSLVVPVYRNEESIPALVQRVVELSSSRDGDFEAVFVVDGSPDASLLVLRRLLPDSGVRAQVVTLSRNFGAFAAIRAGLAAATGEYLAVMAADLQEPASLVEAIFDRLAQGDVDVAVGVRTGRDDPALSSFTSALFWRTYRRFVQRDVPPGGVDIFGCSRQVVLELLRLEEAHSSLVGLLFWVGFRRAEVPYERAEREHGKSAWSLRKKVRYMADSIFSFTDLPILVLITAGVLGVVSSLLGGLVVFVGWASGSVEVAGYTPLMLVLCLLSSSILLALGIVGSYVWRTYENSKRRPFAVPMMHEHFGDRSA